VQGFVAVIVLPVKRQHCDDSRLDPKVVSAAITVIVILNMIGRGLLPKGAALLFKKQALIPDMAFKSSSAKSVVQPYKGLSSF
jgi:hypothetical protein